MKERPILFSAPMVRAILECRKTQTRRVMKPQPERAPVDVVNGFPVWDAPTNYNGEVQMNETRGKACHYGKECDHLWVRETHSIGIGGTSGVWYWADGNPQHGNWTRPKPSIHMPRWASRITLEITGVRVERLQDISEADAIAEGVDTRCQYQPDESPECSPGHRNVDGFALDNFRDLWCSINGPESWAANPWVWVIEFKRIDAIAMRGAA